jgi:hypothetical protein
VNSGLCSHPVLIPRSFKSGPPSSIVARVGLRRCGYTVHALSTRDHDRYYYQLSTSLSRADGRTAAEVARAERLPEMSSSAVSLRCTGLRGRSESSENRPVATPADCAAAAAARRCTDVTPLLLGLLSCAAPPPQHTTQPQSARTQP